MRKSVGILLVLSLALIGCSYGNTPNEASSKVKEKSISEQQVTTHLVYQDVVILEVKKTSIVIAPPASDPEASYPAYLVYIDENTIIKGTKEKFDELVEGDDVSVRVNNEGAEKEVAESIVVY
ncbi:hypothetical protein [Alkalihalobacillus sp. CinArs1]|uniref:hypothetical protein n=1 Tax=Alkalihalobacillus sp. CinArs1 TaxID=2995314 RepID=UPI0022DE9414|nr:hypothetical protein [Alkalihalobacillus sp. CinArs1]